MNSATGRRAALVAALLGLLAFLGGATLAAAHAVPGSAVLGASTATIAGSDLVPASAPAVGDAARVAHPLAVRTSAQDRGPAHHKAGAVLPAMLLLVASTVLASGSLGAWRRPPLAAWRRGLATRAPPGLAL